MQIRATRDTLTDPLPRITTHLYISTKSEPDHTSIEYVFTIHLSETYYQYF